MKISGTHFTSFVHNAFTLINMKLIRYRLFHRLWLISNKKLSQLKFLFLTENINLSRRRHRYNLFFCEIKRTLKIRWSNILSNYKIFLKITRKKLRRNLRFFWVLKKRNWKKYKSKLKIIKISFTIMIRICSILRKMMIFK